MKKLLFCFVGMVFNMTSMLHSASSDTQLINLEVTAINELAITSGGAISLTISTATAGSAPTDAVDATTTYAVTTNAGTDAKKITGAIDTNAPASTTLSVNLAALTGSSSAGTQSLSTTAVDLVTGVDSVAEGSKTITYTFSAGIAAGIIASTPRTVTLTLTNT